MRLRFASGADVPDLLAVYEQYIPTAVTFEYVLPSEQEFLGRVESISKVYPYLVLEEDGAVLGYAYAHRIGSRAAYGWGAELSIYLRREVSGQGIGRRLYQVLMDLLRLQGVRTVYGLVSSPNPASEKLHRALGFEQAGVQRRAGYKNGRWIDLLWFEKAIAPYNLDPAPVTPIGDLPAERVREVLSSFF